MQISSISSNLGQVIEWRKGRRKRGSKIGRKGGERRKEGRKYARNSR